MHSTDIQKSKTNYRKQSSQSSFQFFLLFLLLKSWAEGRVGKEIMHKYGKNKLEEMKCNIQLTIYVNRKYSIIIYYCLSYYFLYIGEYFWKLILVINYKVWAKGVKEVNYLICTICTYFIFSFKWWLLSKIMPQKGE